MIYIHNLHIYCPLHRVVTASERRTAAAERDNEVTATQKLQEALDNLRIDEAMEAIEMGAVVTSAHVHQCSKHIGDEFVPLLNALITASESYTTTRIFKQDKEKHVMECANPVGMIILPDGFEHFTVFLMTYI